MQIPQFMNDPESLDAFKLDPWLTEAREVGVSPEVRAFALGFPRDARGPRQEADRGLAGARHPSTGDALRYPPDIFATLAEATRMAREAVPGGRGADVVKLVTPMARQLLSRAWGDVFLEGLAVSDQLPTVAQVVADPMTTPVPTTLAAAQILGEQLLDAARSQPARVERIEAYFSRTTGAAYAHLQSLLYETFPRRATPATPRVTIAAILQGPTQAPVPAADAAADLQHALELLLEQAERVPASIPVLKDYAARLPGLTKAQALLGLEAFTKRPVQVYDVNARHRRLLSELDALESEMAASGDRGTPAARPSSVGRGGR